MERKKHHPIYNFIQRHTIRGLVTLCLMLAVFVMPLLSEARYKAFLNGFTAVIAKEYYFSSNFLKEGGANYVTNGWDGKDRTLDDVHIRNYDNTLLANQVHQDLQYVLEWKIETYAYVAGEGNTKELKKITDDPTTEDKYECCTLQFTGNDLADSTTNNISTVYATYTPDGTTLQAGLTEGVEGKIEYTITGTGESRKDIYKLQLNVPDEAVLPMVDGCYVEITMVATNKGGLDQRNQYSRTIQSTMRYNVTEMDDFVEAVEITDPSTEPNLMEDVTVKLRTSNLFGAGSIQTIYLWWDLDYLMPDYFNSQFNELFLKGNYEEVSVERGTDEDKITKRYGVLKINARSSSTRVYTLEKVQGISVSDKNLAAKTNYKTVALPGTTTDPLIIGYYMTSQLTDSTQPTEPETTVAATESTDTEGGTP